METYIVKYSKIKLDGIDSYEIDDGIVLKDGKRSLEIEITKSAENNKKASYLEKAFTLTFANNLVSPYCSDEVMKVLWNTRVLLSYYAEMGYEQKDIIMLNENCCDFLKDWYDKLESFYSGEFLQDEKSFAYNAYQSSLSAASVEMSYVNLTTALESLLLTESNKMSKKLSERTAMLLGKDAAEREVIFNQVKKAYNIRSKAIHGDIAKILEQLKSENVFETFLEFRELVAEVMYVTHGKRKEDIIKGIDIKIGSQGAIGN